MTSDMRTTIQFYGSEVALRLKVAGEYASSGMKAIDAIDESDGSLFGRLTINVPGVELQPGEIIVKNYSENEAWVPQVLRNLSQYFVPTGITVKSGFVTMPIYKFIEVAQHENQSDD
jgi:hypothetical protein